MFFTQDDFRKIEDYLKQKGKKDTDFEKVSLIKDNDTVVIVLEGVNKAITIRNLLDLGIGNHTVTLLKLANDVLLKFTSLESNDLLIDAALAVLQNKVTNFPAHIVLTQEQYDALLTKDRDTIYLIVDRPVTPDTDTWTFGGTFPIVFTSSWKFGNSFPIRFE